MKANAGSLHGTGRYCKALVGQASACLLLSFVAGTNSKEDRLKPILLKKQLPLRRQGQLGDFLIGRR
jgi:hypothetical protein